MININSDAQKKLNKLKKDYAKKIADHDAKVKNLQAELAKAENNLTEAKKEYESAKESLKADEMLLAKTKVSGAEEVLEMFKVALKKEQAPTRLFEENPEFKKDIQVVVNSLNDEATEKVKELLIQVKEIITALDEDLGKVMDVSRSFKYKNQTGSLAFHPADKNWFLNDVARDIGRYEHKERSVGALKKYDRS